MTTIVSFYSEPNNLDFLMSDVRLRFGDLTGSIYSDTMIRTALVNSVTYLQPRWLSKYQIYSSSIRVDRDAPAGYIYANTSHGQTLIPSGLADGDIFRNPYIVFAQPSPPIIQSEDQEAIVLAAVLMLRRAQISSSVTAFVSWATEDIKYSNLGSERSLSNLLSGDQQALDLYFKTKIAKPQISQFPIIAISEQTIAV